MEPRRFGRYELVTKIGAGGMATIYLARIVGPSGFQKHLVIKKIHDKMTANSHFVNMLLDEARLAARIEHPNVVQVHECDKQDGAYYIAMEYVHGQDAAEIYQEARRNPSCGYHWSHAAYLLSEAAAGLHAAHELVGDDGRPLNLVHRDVSPQNILVSYGGHVKVTDFGIAHAEDRLQQTMAGTVKGKLAYMSPEQVQDLKVDRRSDVFSLGTVLHELVSLRRLFRADTEVETMQRIVMADALPLRQVKPDVPAELEQIVSKALARDPRQRYQTAYALQRALQELLQTAGVRVDAASLGSLMGSLFEGGKSLRDKQIRWIYQKTWPEKSDPGGDSSWVVDNEPTTTDVRPPTFGRVPSPGTMRRDPSAAAPPAPTVNQPDESGTLFTDDEPETVTDLRRPIHTKPEE